MFIKKESWKKALSVVAGLVVVVFLLFFQYDRQLTTIALVTVFLTAGGVVYYFYQQLEKKAAKTDNIRLQLEKEIQQRREIASQLNQATVRLTLATSAGKIGVWEWDAANNRMYWDAEMYRLYEVSAFVQPDYQMWRNLVDKEDINRVEHLLDKAVKEGTDFDAEFCIHTKSGEVKYIYAVARSQPGETENSSVLVGVSWELTQRKKIEQELVAERWRLSAIIEGTNAGTWEWNVHTGVFNVNERWAEMLGYKLSELCPLTMATNESLIEPNDYQQVELLLEEHFTGETEYYEAEFRMQHKDGYWVWVASRGKVAQRKEDGTPLLMYGTHIDISEQKQIEENIRHLANHDTLTGLPVLRLARERIAMTLAAGARRGLISAICFIDLDGFKAINDSLGHDAGDTLLKEVARRLYCNLRQMDTVARIGGDEFLVVLSEMKKKADIEKVAMKLVTAISSWPYNLGEETAEVSLSMGIALFQGAWNEEDISVLISRADEAMYTVKKSGKNGYAFAG